MWSANGKISAPELFCPQNFSGITGVNKRGRGTCRATWYVGTCRRVNQKMVKIYYTKRSNFVYSWRTRHRDPRGRFPSCRGFWLSFIPPRHLGSRNSQTQAARGCHSRWNLDGRKAAKKVQLYPPAKTLPLRMWEWGRLNGHFLTFGSCWALCEKYSFGFGLFWVRKFEIVWNRTHKIYIFYFVTCTLINFNELISLIFYIEYANKPIFERQIGSLCKKMFATKLS